MNDLLFYALLAALLYYFFIYLPSQKSRPALKPSTDNRPEIPKIHFPLRPSIQEQATQTETPVMEYEPRPEIINCPGPQFEPSPTLKHLQDQNTALLQDQAQKERTITELKESLKFYLDNLKVKEKIIEGYKEQEQDNKSVEQALDQLIKNINKLSQEIQ